MNTRLRKVGGDLLVRWRRTLLTIAGLAAGLGGAGTVLVALVTLWNDLDANFLQTSPPHVVARSWGGSDLASRIVALPGVTAVADRPLVGARVEVGNGRWMSAVLFVVTDFERLDVARFYPHSGAWPPAPGSWLMERDGRFFLRQPEGSPIRLRLGNGATVTAPLAGTVFDPGQAPSRMDRVLYGYITPETAAGWGLEAGHRWLITAARDADIDVLAHRVQELLPAGSAPVSRYPQPEHPHQFQLDTILALLAGLGLVSLAMCVVLVVNLVDSVLAAERRSIGVMKAMGGRTVQIARDYLLGVGLLGALAAAISLPLALPAGRAIGVYMARFLNFELTSAGTPAWLPVALLALGTAVPMVVAGRRVFQTAGLPVRRALDRVWLTRSDALTDVTAGLRWLPTLPAIAIRSLVRRPGRVLMTSAALALGLLFFIVALNLRSSVLETVDSVARTRQHDLVLSFREAWPVADLTSWAQAFPVVVSSEPWLRDQGQLGAADGRRSNSAPVLGLPLPSAVLTPDVIAGRWLQPGDVAAIVVTQKLQADAPWLEVGRRYQLAVDEGTETVELVGMVKEFGAGSIYAPRSLVARLNRQAGQADTLLVRLNDSSFGAQRRAAAELESSLVDTPRQLTSVVTTGILAVIVRAHLDVIVALLMVIAGLLLVVAAFGLASSISVSIIERYRELGVLKALGAGAGAIALIFGLEAVLLAALGWLMALPLAPGLSRLLSGALGTAIVEYPFAYRGSPAGYLGALGVAVVVAVIAALAPVIAASRIPTQRALRSE